MLKYFTVICLLCFSDLISGQCTDNQYNENQQKETSTCAIWGNYHVKTFDDHGLHFQSDCTFTLTSFMVGKDNFRIDISGYDQDCRRAKEGCSSSLKILLGNKNYGLSRSGFTIDDKKETIPFESTELRVYRSVEKVIINFLKIGVVLTWEPKVIVEVTIENNKQYEMFGLCGNNDKCSSNDQMLVNKAIENDLRQFLQEWQVGKQSCRSAITTESKCRAKFNQDIAKNACEVLKKNKFTEANKKVNPALYIEACVWDYCSCRQKKTQDCLCDSLNAYARASVNAGVRKVSWRDRDTCPKECPEELVFYPCSPKDGSLTCDGNSIKPQNEKCEEGCYCPARNYLFGEKCFLRKNCPCVFNTKEYKPGESYKQECNTCTCKDGKITCTEKTCMTDWAHSIGDPHYVTWDGRRFNFMGKCAYYLIKGKDYSVEADHYVYRHGTFVKEYSNAPSYAAIIIIRVPGLVVELKQGLVVTANGEIIKRFPVTIENTLITKPSAGYVLVELPNKIQVMFNGFAGAYYRLPTSMQGKVMGLLGTYTDDTSDDFLTPDGDIIDDPLTFGNSWKTEYSCQDSTEDPVHPCDANPGAKGPAEKVCSIMKSSLFKGCQKDDIQIDFENCVYDTCYCKENATRCSCDIIESFAKVCAKQGIIVDWRKDIPECRLPCPAGQVYQPCGDMCTRSCEDISLRPYCETDCVDGCNCAPGTTMDEDGKCIPIEKCKCRINEIVYPPGYQIRKNDDEIITCTKAKWISSVPDESQTLPPTANQLDDKCDPKRFSVYTPCRRTTPLTCQNMHDYEISAIELCQEGCECMKGYVFDPLTEACIKPEDCPCLQNKRSYEEGSVIVQEGCNRCKCVNRSWQCAIENCENLCTGNETKQIDCNTCTCKDALWSCTQNDCSQKCPYEAEVKKVNCNTCTCANGFWKCTNNVCECEDGQERQEGCKSCACVNGAWKCNEEKCVTNNCAKEGEVSVQEFGQCMCKGGIWKCADGQCDVWGDSHVKTFDQARFDFRGVCSYVLAEAEINGDKFKVHFTNEICSQTGATCFKSAIISVNIGGVQESITLVKNVELPNAQNLKKMILTDTFLFTTIEIVEAGIKVFWDKKTWLYIKLDHRWQRKVTGLCGNFNRQKGDDLQIYDVRNSDDKVLAFVDLWRNEDNCALTKSNENKCDKKRMEWTQKQCSVMKSDIFLPCHQRVPVEDYYQACIMDSCKCDLGGDCECLCTAIGTYAQQCNNYGVPIKWRSQKLCPIQCLTNTEYEPCTSTCPKKTCETVQKGITIECEKEICMEGCDPKPLPAGYIYTNSTYQKYIPEKSCKSQCNFGGNIYYDGDIIEKIGCSLCICSNGKKDCVDIPSCTEDPISEVIPPIEDQRTDGSTTVRTSLGTKGPEITTTPIIGTQKPVITTTPIIGTQTPVTSTPKIGTESPDGSTTVRTTLGTKGPEITTTPIIGTQKPVITTTPIIGTQTPVVTPPECNKNECKPLKCPAFAKEVEIEGQCCKSCQHATDCMVTLQYSKRAILKKPGQTWTDGPCKECACVGKKKYNHCTQCKEKKCVEITAKNVTTEDNYYEITKGPCCSSAEPVACVHNKKIYRIGELWNVDACKSFKCIEDPVSKVPVKQETTVFCNKVCPAGYVYKESKNECCGRCVQNSCIFNDKAKKPGEMWQTKDGCTHYTCDFTQGQYKVFSSTIVCPPIINCPNATRKDRCCEYCSTSELFKWQDEPLRCNYLNL